MRIEEEKYLKYKICEDYIRLFPNGATAKDLVDKIENGELQLEIVEKLGSIIFDEECFDEIQNIIPNLHRIIEKPRSFIKSLEEKTPVETAKRINMKAISHLSRDSNDWCARTFLSVKPKSIISDVNEETIELYENRFIITLIDRILGYVISRRQKLTELVERLKNEIAITCIESDFKTEFVRLSNNSNSLLRAILSNNNSVHGGIFLEEVQKELEKILSLENKIKAIKRSDFYSSLRRCRRVHDPIKKTNIIMFEQNYNKCFRLWDVLNKQNQEEDFSLEDEERKSIDKYYILYCVIVVIAAICNMGFEEEGNAYVDFCEEVVIFNKEFYFQRNEEKIRLTLRAGSEILVSYCIDSEKDKWNTFCIKPNYFDFENKAGAEIEIETTSIINNLIIPKSEKNSLIGQYAFVSLDINRCSESNDYGEKLYRRFFNIGDNYSEKEINLSDIASYKTGMLIISPADIRFNLLRIERLINSHLLRSKKFKEFEAKCPICNMNKIKVTSNNEIVCYNCNHRISISSCVNCKKELLWIKYLDDKAVTRKEIISDLEGKPYYFKLRRYEAVMGAFAISSFLLEKEAKSNEWKLKSVCPHCGVKLGDTRQN